MAPMFFYEVGLGLWLLVKGIQAPIVAPLGGGSSEHGNRWWQMSGRKRKTATVKVAASRWKDWLRGQDLNLRPLGYEL